ncbi:MAG: hypothetical protein OXI87_18665 [Albidovulum sp.]|nr:hypothetical protein [Albidovulum sp.]MDE0530750.1 hypothetical protein [Albidovulum sp.]
MPKGIAPHLFPGRVDFGCGIAFRHRKENLAFDLGNGAADFASHGDALAPADNNITCLGTNKRLLPRLPEIARIGTGDYGLIE